jgi:hypothetical protein
VIVLLMLIVRYSIQLQCVKMASASIHWIRSTAFLTLRHRPCRQHVLMIKTASASAHVIHNPVSAFVCMRWNGMVLAGCVSNSVWKTANAIVTLSVTTAHVCHKSHQVDCVKLTTIAMVHLCVMLTRVSASVQVT